MNATAATAAGTTIHGRRSLRRVGMGLYYLLRASPPAPRAGGGRLAPELQRLVLLEDRLLQTLERRARLDAELVHEGTPRPLIRVERLRLPAGPVESEHQLSAQAFS